MSEKFKVSGKKFELPSTDRSNSANVANVRWRVRPGGWAVGTFPDGSQVRAFLNEARGQLGVAIGGFLYQGQVQSESVGGASGSGGDSDLVAQFPGKVRKVLVLDGATVKESDPLVLVEAMKMEFTIKAPFDGKVSKVLVKEGQQLAPGDRFVELEAMAEARE